MTPRSFALSAALATALLLATAAPALADRVLLKNGETVEGTIISDTPEAVEIEFRKGNLRGTRRIERSEIKQVIKEESAEARFEKLAAAAKTADELVKVADDAKAAGAERAVKAALERAIKLDPEHAKARELLGFKKIDGKWLPEADWKAREKAAADKDKKGKESADAEKKYEEELQAGEWHTIETKTKRFQVRCNSTKAVAQRYADFMDKIVLEYDKVFKKQKKYWEGQSKIYIFASNDDFVNMLGQEEGVGGFYRAKSPNVNAYPDRIVAAFHGSFGTGDTRLVLAHECTHQVHHTLSDGDEIDWAMRPKWFKEGLACYLGDGFVFDKKGNLKIQVPRMRLGVIQRYLKDEGFMAKWPISKFMRQSPREWGMSTGLGYPYAWALTYYFQKRGEVVKKSGPAEQKPVKIKIDGKDREVNLAKAMDALFEAMAKKPPAEARDPRGNGSGEHCIKRLEELLGFPVDALAADFRDFILKLEAPLLGKVDKKKFISAECAFEIEGPGGKWKWNQDDCIGDEAVRIENPDTGAMITVEVDGNMNNENLEKIIEGVKNLAGRKIQELNIETDEASKLATLDAWQLVYAGTEKALIVGQEVRPGEQKFRHITLGGNTIRRTYQIICSAPKDKFDESAAAFDKVIASFVMKGE